MSTNQNTLKVDQLEAHLLLQVAGNLVSAQLFVAVKINLFEDIDWSWSLLSTHKLNIKVKSCSTGDNVSSA